MVLTIALPSTRTDGSPLAPEALGIVHIFRADNGGDPQLIGTIPATQTKFTDTFPGVGSYRYTASVVDLQVTPAESGASNEFVVDVVPDLAPPSAPTISGLVS